MSARESVLEALGEVPRTRHELADECGTDVQHVSVALTGLKNEGLARRTLQGWVRSGADDAAPAAPVTAADDADPPIAPEPPAPEPPARTASKRAKKPKQTRAPKPKRTRAAKPKRKPARRKVQQAATRVATTATPLVPEGTLRYSLDESCRLAIERADGSGNRAFIAREDALRLMRFLATCRPVLEAA